MENELECVMVGSEERTAAYRIARYTVLMGVMPVDMCVEQRVCCCFFFFKQ